MESAEVRRRFGEARVAHLATVASDGNPHIVPCVFALAEVAVFTPVDDKPKRSRDLKRLANIRAHPRVSVIAGDYDEDWSKLWWVRADGDATIHEAGPAADEGIALLRAKYPQYARRPDPGPIIVVEVQRWSAWTGS
ncbi:MAG: TIGR03668 family PPOX class F420-dependent oxidoreductase [Actinomycetota bacterium]|nr:TIGR03668 family PPOX class F420-dependent oxidoreductase [Actinomycetota bacterium]